MTNNTLTQTTVKPYGKEPPEDDDETRIIIISCATIGGVIFIVLVFLFYYCYMKRKHAQQTPSGATVNVEIEDDIVSIDDMEKGKLNQGLETSISEIYKSTNKVPVTGQFSANSLTEIKQADIDPIDEIIHNISIKLLTHWSDIYNRFDSKEYMDMKELIQSSMNTIYLSYDGFESATLLKFRKGSVIADIQLRFYPNATNPLSMLEKAIKSGKCADLVVDKSYFKILMPNLETIDGFTQKEIFEVPRRNDRESGYYGGSEEDELNINKPLKNRSTKSTQSCDSMTSEMGSSYVSSTNISINSGPEEEGHEIGEVTSARSRKLKTGLLPHFTKHGKTKPNVRNKTKLIIGQQHKAIFDFHPQAYRELKLRTGELVNILDVSSNGWAKAMNEQKEIGLIPQHFVFPYDVQKDKDIKYRAEAITLLDGLQNALDDELASSDEEVHAKEEDDDDKEDSDSNDDLFITIYPFDPSEKNELKLDVGDLIDVLKTDETGWWKGQNLMTELDGWFPSSYVKPYTPNMHILPEDEKAISLSDSEIMKRTGSVDEKKRNTDGYSSDNGQIRTKISKEEENTEESSEETPRETDEVDGTTKEKADESTGVSGVVLRDKKGTAGLKGRAVSLIIDTAASNTKPSPAPPLTPPPRLSAHRDHGTEKTFADPPSKPVPPKPRQKHIEKEINNLVASGRLGSQDSLMTVSTECLATLNRSPHKRGSGKRRNSEEIASFNNDGVIKRQHDSKINRIRPKSFQETPKTSFLYLANRYADIKPAFSLPSLVCDQVKLSPDDDRPFLDPIPRRAKSRSLVGSASELTSSLKDLSVIIRPDSDLSKDNVRSEINDTTNKSDQLKSASQSSIHQESNEESDTTIQKKPLPQEPEEARPVIAPKPSHFALGPNSMISQLLASKTLHGTRPPSMSQKPVVPLRSSSKNKITMKLIEEQRQRQGGLLSEHYLHPRGPTGYGRLRHQKHLSSFESINEESEQGNTPKDEAAKLPGDHDHRRCRSEPHQHILQNEMVHFTLTRSNTNELASSPSPPSSPTNSDSLIHMAYDERDRTLTYNSRASSLQSLTSVASSARSTASSKHEQQNLRRAIMNVHGQGENDLSYTVGAILYELRPRNKHGLCYGILEDSTQGWFPAESVEPYQVDQQL